MPRGIALRSASGPAQRRGLSDLAVPALVLLLPDATRIAVPGLLELERKVDTVRETVAASESRVEAQLEQVNEQLTDVHERLLLGLPSRPSDVACVMAPSRGSFRGP
jgi:hypothetical protein